MVRGAARTRKTSSLCVLVETPRHWQRSWRDARCFVQLSRDWYSFCFEAISAHSFLCVVFLLAFLATMASSFGDWEELPSDSTASAAHSWTCANLSTPPTGSEGYNHVEAGSIGPAGGDPNFGLVYSCFTNVQLTAQPLQEQALTDTIKLHGTADAGKLFFSPFEHPNQKDGGS